MNNQQFLKSIRHAKSSNPLNHVFHIKKSVTYMYVTIATFEMSGCILVVN